MNLMRILVIAALGLTVAPSYAAPVLFTLEAEPFTEWEITLRDSGGMITSLNVGDADGDGMSSFAALDDSDAAIDERHPFLTPALWGLRTHNTLGSGIPFLTSIAGDPLIVDWTNGASGMFTLGQQVAVTGGAIGGLGDGSVRFVTPGITTALDLLATDLRTLPTFTGVAEVAGLMTIQVIPEPSTGALVLFAMTSIGVIACRKRIVSRRTAP